MFAVIGTEVYLAELGKWPTADRQAAEKLPGRLAQNPWSGTSLGLPFFREKRVRGQRIYYLVYEDLKMVLLVATSGKKDQQITIEYVKQRLSEFRRVAEDVAKRFA